MEREDMEMRVREAHVARLATIDPDGRPHLVPICFALAGDTVYTAVDEKPKRSRRLRRLSNVRADQRVTVLVDHYEDDWERLWWVRLRGSGRIVEQGPELEKALALLREKYAQYRARPPAGPVLAIRLDDWQGWSAAA